MKEDEVQIRARHSLMTLTHQIKRRLPPKRKDLQRLAAEIRGGVLINSWGLSL